MGYKLKTLNAFVLLALPCSMLGSNLSAQVPSTNREPTYSVHTIRGILESDGNVTVGKVSNYGDVLATSTRFGSPRTALIWNGTTGIRELLEIPDGYPYDLNDAGEFVGMFAVNDVAQAFISMNGTISPVVGAGLPSSALAINARGDLVGKSGYPNNQQGWLKRRESQSLDHIPSLGGVWLQPSDLNDRGIVVGLSAKASSPFGHAFRWSAESGTKALAELDGPSSMALAVNNRGVIVGSVSRANGRSEAAMWDRDRLNVLGTLEGHNFAAASDINQAGWVVGTSQVLGSPTISTKGFVYVPSLRKMIQLDGAIEGNSGWTILSAYGVNDAGWITATAKFGPMNYAVVLKPVNSRSR